jgi:hypothetical protein
VQDRDIFNAKLAEINEKTAISGAATTVDEALAVVCTNLIKECGDWSVIRAVAMRL